MGGDRQRGRGSFGGEFGAFYCNQWGRRRALPKLLWGGLVNITIEMNCGHRGPNFS